MKQHGLRPQDKAIAAPQAADLLDCYTPIMGLTLLKLDEKAAKAFHEFHGIRVVDGKVIMPKAESIEL